MPDATLPPDLSGVDLTARFQAEIRRVIPTVITLADGAGITISGALLAFALAPLLGANLAVPAVAWLTGLGANALAGWLGGWGQQALARYRSTRQPIPEATLTELAQALSTALATDPRLQAAAAAVLQGTDAAAVALANLPTRAEQRDLLQVLAADFHRTQDHQTGVLSQQLVAIQDRLAALHAQLQAAPGTAPIRFDGIHHIGMVVGGDVHYHYGSAPATTATAPPADPQPLTNLPYHRNLSFVGRTSEITQIEQGLAAGRAVAVTGMGGLGKTQVAVEVAARTLDAGRYPGGVWWVPMGAPEAVEGLVAALSGPSGMALPGWEEGKQAANLVLVQRAWSTPIARLLICDNLEDPNLWQRWQPPPGSGCRVLITTRRGQWPKHSGVQKVHLPPLVLSESRDLLLGSRAVSQETTVAALLADTSIAAAVDAIAKAVDGLPLALALAAAYLEAMPGVSVPRYWVQLEARASQIVNDPSLNMVLADDLPTKHATSIAATFALSYDQLNPAIVTDALARRLLHAAAVAAPAPIPRPLLYRAGAANPQEPLPPETADPALARLSALGLLDELPDSALRLHRLLAAYVQTRPRPGDDAAARLEAALGWELHYINEAGYPLAGTSYLPHLRHAAAGADPRGDAAAASLLNNLAVLLSGQGDYAVARLLHERALVITETIYGLHHPIVATDLSNLAAVLLAQGNYAKALPLHQRALAIRETTFGPTHPITAQSLNNLAELLRTLQQHATARPLYERALAIHEAVFGPHHRTTATSLNNLALLLVAQSDYIRARPLYERALTIQEEILGPKHPDTARSLSNLAALLEAQGDYVAARPLYERALAIRETTLGLSHPSTALSLNNLAVLLITQGDYAAAFPLLDRAVMIVEQALGPDHPHTRGGYASRTWLINRMGDTGRGETPPSIGDKGSQNSV